MPVDITFPELEFGIRAEDQACLIPISVGQKYHDPVPFEETLNLLARQNYKKYVIIVADTLQHYTLRMRKSFLKAEEALIQAKEKGNAWLTISQPIIERALAGKTVEIVRWEECLNDPLSTPAMREISERYSSDDAFRASVHHIVETYLDGFEHNGKKKKHHDRVVTHGEEKTPEQLRKEKLCTNYVLEETALIMVWQNKQCNLAWPADAQRFFLAYAFGGHDCNEAILSHLTQLCQGNSYQLLNIKVSTEPKKQKKPTEGVLSENPAKSKLTLAAILMALELSDLSPETQIALLAMATQKVTTKYGEEEFLKSSLTESTDAASAMPTENLKRDEPLVKTPPTPPLSIPILNNIAIPKSQYYEEDTLPSSRTSGESSNASSLGSERGGAASNLHQVYGEKGSPAVFHPPISGETTTRTPSPNAATR